LVRYSLYELNKTGDKQHPCLSALRDSHLLFLLGLAIRCHLIHKHFPDQYLFLVSRQMCVCVCVFFFTMVQQPPVGQGLLTVEASRSHSDTLHLVGLLWTSDQPEAETSTCQHKTLTTDRHPCHRLVSNPQSQHASGRRPTP